MRTFIAQGAAPQIPVIRMLLWYTPFATLRNDWFSIMIAIYYILKYCRCASSFNRTKLVQVSNLNNSFSRVLNKSIIPGRNISHYSKCLAMLWCNILLGFLITAKLLLAIKHKNRARLFIAFPCPLPWPECSYNCWLQNFVTH